MSLPDDLVPAAFLDRDGVLNRRLPEAYVTCCAELELLPHATEAARRLRAAGFLLVVVTNQRGIARGLMSEADLELVHAQLREHFRAAGAPLAGIYHCPHERDAGCVCRKPAPGLLLRAAQELRLDLARSLLIGDSSSDIGAARAAGVTRSVLIPSDSDLRLNRRRSACQEGDLAGAANLGSRLPCGTAPPVPARSRVARSVGRFLPFCRPARNFPETEISLGNTRLFRLLSVSNPLRFP
jgi:D-glycero-D-manno-heptose 1,7-bisphosphate phosphatase